MSGSLRRLVIGVVLVCVCIFVTLLIVRPGVDEQSDWVSKVLAGGGVGIAATLFTDDAWSAWRRRRATHHGEHLRRHVPPDPHRLAE